MATINLGAIKFNWKGAYNSSTTYAVDDVVSSGGNSYVCIQAHSNQAVGNATAYWNIMSSAGTNGTNGTNGTDVGTVITTQGDILYRDGSGLQRLAKPASDKFLQNTSGGVLSWEELEAGGTSWQAVKTGDFTAAAGQGVFCNTTSGSFTLTLPSSPTIGDEVSFIDYAGTFDTNALTIGRNSSKINGAEADLTVSVERAANTLVFTDSTQGWLLKSK